MYDAIGQIPDKMIEDSDKFWENKKKYRRNMMIRFGSLAACFCIITLAAVGVLFGRNTDNTPKYDIVSTENFQKLFFGLAQSVSEPADGGVSGIWANPIRPGHFRTSITLSGELETAEDGKYFALIVDYVVSDEVKDEAAALNEAYEFFKNQGFEVGIIDGRLYIAATKAQIVKIRDTVMENADVGAEFRLANPTDEQKELESKIRY
jgi:hypothetical protein